MKKIISIILCLFLQGCDGNKFHDKNVHVRGYIIKVAEDEQGNQYFNLKVDCKQNDCDILKINFNGKELPCGGFKSGVVASVALINGWEVDITYNEIGRWFNQLVLICDVNT
jgi:hypothetical protein